MKLYGASLSPFFERVVIMLDIKGQLDAIEQVPPPGGLGSAQMKAMNPTGKIPVLELDDGRHMIEGQIIMEYLDAEIGNPLMPADPVDAAAVKLMGRLYDLYFIRAAGPVFSSAVFGHHDEIAVQQAISTDMPQAADHIEHYISTAGRAVGPDWTLADCVLIPMMWQQENIYRRFGFDLLAGRPKLSNWWERVGETQIAADCFTRMTRILEFVQARKG